MLPNQGEAGYLFVAALALTLWVPALAVATLAVRAIHGILRRRGAGPQLSVGAAATAGLAILIAYAPLYTMMIVGLLDSPLFDGE